MTNYKKYCTIKTSILPLQTGDYMDLENSIKYSIMLDFYGNLLTDKQLAVAKMFFYDNISLSEIAGLDGLTRQAVYDIIKRIKLLLIEYEQKLGLYGKYIESKKFLKKHLNNNLLNEFTKIWEN